MDAGQKHFQAWKMGHKHSELRSPRSPPREWNKLRPDRKPPAAASEGQGSAALGSPREELRGSRARPRAQDLHCTLLPAERALQTFSVILTRCQHLHFRIFFFSSYSFEDVSTWRREKSGV